MAAFVRGEMRQSVRYALRILLLVTGTFRLFGGMLKLSRISAVPQKHRRPLRILNLSEKPNVGTPSVNNTTDREVTYELMYFVHAFSCVLQAI